MKKRFDRHLIKQLWTYLHPYRALVAFALGIMLISKGIEAYVPVYIGEISQSILSDASLALLPSIIQQSLGIMGLLLVAYLLDSVNVFLKNWVGQRALFQLRADVYRHLQKMPVPFYNRQRVGTLMTRTIHDVDQINQMFAEGIVPIIGSAILFFSIAIALVVIEWRLALLLGAILPVVFWMTNSFRVNQRRCYDKVRHVVAQMNAFVQEHLFGASTIRSFGLQEVEKKHFDTINEEHRKANVETIHYFALFFAGIDFVQSFSLIAVFVVLVFFASPIEGFQAGLYFTFSLYVLMLFRPLADLADRYNLLQSAMAAANRIFDLLDQPEEVQVKGPSISQIDEIVFENVWFAYKGEEWVLKGLTFQLKRGESLALVGMTGAGKTTILNLLLRFHDHQKGSIRINGKEIADYSIEEVRRQFSVVLQDPEIFSGTIRENICLDCPSISSETLDEVIDTLGLHPFLARFPKGAEQTLTERGKSLSAGERQLISLARAAAHGRSCLILDEATANIDTKSEKIIQKALKKILHDKTAIVIAHRLSTIKDVSRILVLHHGIAFETGTHEELLKGKGIYEKLYRLQFQ